MSTTTIGVLRIEMHSPGFKQDKTDDRGLFIPLAQARALIAEEAVIVPVEPTKEQIKACIDCFYGESTMRNLGDELTARRLYKAMIKKQ